MGLFQEFRERGWNTYYSDKPIPFELDVTTVIVTYLAVVLAAAMIMIVIGTRGHERWRTFFRILASVHTGVIIVVGNVSQSWQVGHVHSHCQYSTELDDGINADVGLYIGLKSVNITLRGNDSVVRRSGRINYNEEFSFDHAQDIQSNYRAALERGLPQPVIYSLEFFRVDAGGFVWRRAVRSAGHFTYIILWTAFVAWLVANILLCFEPVRGLAMITLTGGLMLTGTIVYHAVQPTDPLVIHFEDGLLIPVYGWSFWLVFAAGMLASLVGVCLLVLYVRYPTTTSRLFLVDDSNGDNFSRQLYDYSPGPLKIDTPHSRRTNRLACRRSDNATVLGISNKAFLLDDLPSWSSSQEADTVARSDRQDTDDEGQSGGGGLSSTFIDLSRTESGGGKRRSTATVDDSCRSMTTSVVIEHSVPVFDVNDNISADVDRQSSGTDVVLQPSTSAASTDLTSVEYPSTT